MLDAFSKLSSKVPAKYKLSLSTILLSLSIFVVGQSFGILAYVLVGGLNVDELSIPRAMTVGIVTNIAMLGLVWLVLRPHLRTTKKILQALSLKKPKWTDLGYAIVGFGLYFLAGIVAFYALDALQLIDTGQPQEIGFSNPVGYEYVLVFIALVIMPPLVEEILFRGFIYKRLKKLISVYPAAIITSLLFGLAHAQFNVGIDTFLLSLAMIYVYEETKSLTAPILLHAIKNLHAFIALFIING